MQLYPDTNVMRYMGEAFTDRELNEVVRPHILLSPLSVLEFLAQLSDSTALQVRQHMEALVNWTNDRQAVLDMPDDFMWELVSHEKRDDDGFCSKLANSIQVVLNSVPGDPAIRAASKNLRNLLQEYKMSSAQRAQDVVTSIREEFGRRTELPVDSLRTSFRDGMAKRLGRDIEDVTIQRFEAYFHYLTRKFRLAVPNLQFNFLSKKKLNDQIDAEQLIYLAEPNCHFITTDLDYRKTFDGMTIPNLHVVPAVNLRDPDMCTELLARICAG